MSLAKTKRWGGLLLWLTTSAALGAPPGVPETKISIQFQQTQLKSVFLVLSGAAELIPVRFAPCVPDVKIDLRLEDVPLPLALDLLASRLGLTLARAGNGLAVGCAQAAVSPAAAKATRVTVDARDAGVDDVMKDLARQVGAQRVEGVVLPGRTVTMHLEGAQLETVNAALLDTAGVFFSLEHGVLVVGSVPRVDDPSLPPKLGELRPFVRPAEPARSFDAGRLTTDEARVLYLSGYQLNESDPKEALRLYLRVWDGTPAGDPYHVKAEDRIRALTKQ